MARLLSLLLLLGMSALATPSIAQGIGPMPTGAQQADRTVVSRDLGQLPLGGGASSEPSAGTTALVGSLESTDSAAPSTGVTRTLMALAGVIALILTMAWAFKKVSARSGGLAGAVGAGGRAPAGLVEVLARYPIASRQTLVVLRFDRRVLLCSMTPGGRGVSAGMTTLCELNDPEDVASVLLKTRDEAGESIARSFERSLREADDYARRSESVEVGAGMQPVPAGRASGNAGPLARGLEALWRGRQA